MNRLEAKRMTKVGILKINIVVLLVIMTIVSGCGTQVDASDNETAIGVSYEEVDTSAQVDDAYDTDSSEIGIANEAISSDIKITDTSAANEATDKEDNASNGKEEPSLSNIEGVDIDLTALSSTVVYGQVYNMMYYPEKFVGKTIRMEGMYSDYFDEAKNFNIR